MPLVLAAACLGGWLGGSAAEPDGVAAPAPAVLDLADGGFLVGRLVPAAAAEEGQRPTLFWETPLFREPIEFDAEGVERIRFPSRTSPPVPAEAWRIDLQGGGFVAGAIEALDADHVVLDAVGVGAMPLRILRGSIVRMSRQSAAARVIVPGSLAEWTTGHGGWQEFGGRLVGTRPGSGAYRDVAAAPRACFEITLSWDERPDFELLFAVDRGAIAGREAGRGSRSDAALEQYRVELMAGELLVIREGATAAFDMAGSIPAGGGELRLQVFVDQESGRLAVVRPDREAADKPVFDGRIAPRAAGVRPGFGVVLRGGSLRIDSLRVVPWEATEPRLPTSGDLGGPDAVLESFDKSRGTFTVRGPAGSRVVAAADLSTIELAGPAAPPALPAGATVWAAFHGGSRLAGRIAAVSQASIRLACPALADPLDCDLGQLAGLEVLTTRPSALPGRPGLLEAESGRMLGCLANADGAAAGIAWQPRGAVKPVALAGAEPLRISYRALAALGGVGLEFVRQGPAWLVADVAAGGPAARDGRIRDGWRLDAIRLDGGAAAIPAADIAAKELRGLLRGVVGSTVQLLVADPTGEALEIALVRDANGRGELAGAAEQDVLEQALKIHEERSAAPVAAATGQATVYLKTGDSIVCTVLSADPQGLRIKTDLAADVTVPAVAIRAVELLPAAAGAIAKEKLARLLTLPRLQQADPPTQMLRLVNGDYLRGKLVALDDAQVRFNVLGTIKDLPRAEVARLIWLSVEGDLAESRALAAVTGEPVPGGLAVRATMTDGRRLSLAAERVAGDRLVGTSGVLGTTGIDLARCDHLDVGTAAIGASPVALPYAQWQLKPATVPRLLKPAAAPPNAAPVPRPAASPHPLAGQLAAVPILPLLEPDAMGRRSVSPGTLAGRVAVLGLFNAADRASIEMLPPLAKALEPLAAQGVTFAAVAEGDTRASVAVAVAGLEPKPPVALDPTRSLHDRLAKPALPVCLILDCEGRVADVMPVDAAGIGRVHDRAAEIAAGSRDAVREFEALFRARELAIAGDRACLGQFGRLLDATSTTVRRRSIGQLRQLTGLTAKEVPFSPEAPPAERVEQARRWRQWLAKEGISAKLSFPKPVAAGWADARPIEGRTLVCRPQNGDVVELDDQDQPVFRVGGVGAWACDVTAEGHRLVGEHAGRAVVEYDASGTEVWAVRNLPGGPMSVRRLASGNTLVALSDANTVVEFDRTGKIVWSVKVEGRPCDARRLPDGGTLVAAHRANRIVEVDASGTETWAVEKIEDPQTAQRLPDGNTLVAMSGPGIIREIDREGRVVWQKDGIRVPVDVQRLPDGRTLVQEQGGDLIEFDADGAEVGRRNTGGSRFVRY